MFDHPIHIWKLIAGLGIFLLGMTQIESSLQELSNRSIKSFLKKHTQNIFKSISFGIISTAILQSSSIVSLIVLAFVGARIISMKNALGIIIGSNLGTTFTGWIVATIGFQFNLEAYTLPLIGLGSLGFIFFKEKPLIRHLSCLSLGLGFLLMGLDFMKSGTEQITESLDITWLNQYPLIVYLLFSILITALIQSSSAMVMITLSTLHAGAIDFLPACAIVIGADLGTTITTLIGSIKGNQEKKQVALAHFIFNLVTDFLAFVLLKPLIFFVENILLIENQLYKVVAFHSSFNFLGIIIFLPFMKKFSHFLKHRFVKPSNQSAQFIHQVEPQVFEASLEALKKETQSLILKVIQFNFLVINPQKKSFFNQRSAINSYHQIKEIEGEIISYCTKLQINPLISQQVEKINQIILIARQSTYSAKFIKDIQHNIDYFLRSSDQFMIENYSSLQVFLENYYQLSKKSLIDNNIYQENLSIKEIESFHQIFSKNILANITKSHLLEIEISTLLNVNSEILNSNKSLKESIETYFQLENNFIN